MCGIFGYYNYQVARDRATILSFLINGLRRLEYRGYDSSGICIDGTEEDFEAPCNGHHGSEDVSRQNGKRFHPQCFVHAANVLRYTPTQGHHLDLAFPLQDMEIFKAILGD